MIVQHAHKADHIGPLRQRLVGEEHIVGCVARLLFAVRVIDLRVVQGQPPIAVLSPFSMCVYSLKDMVADSVVVCRHLRW